ncbi:MAG: hypothetical protein AAB483_02740 [Patescibacteria group bacterium]
MSEPGDPTKPSMPPTLDEANRDVLSLAEFKRRDARGVPRYHNFYLLFAAPPDSYPAIYRDQPYYQRFATENSKLANFLYSSLQVIPKTGSPAQYLEPFESLLYDAYVTMRSYGASDDDLFR